MTRESSNDYKEFAGIQPIRPPESLGVPVFERVRADLSPRPLLVFSKLALIHLFAGSATLLVCPQFNLNVTGSPGLMPILMRYGENACMFGCGALFLGISALVATISLQLEEIRVLRRSQILQLLALALISVAAFICTGFAALGTLALAWVAGSVLGGMGCLELGWAIRSKVFANFG